MHRFLYFSEILNDVQTNKKRAPKRKMRKKEKKEATDRRENRRALKWRV